MSLSEVAEQLWRVARTCEAEKEEVKRRFEEQDTNAMRQRTIRQQHQGRKYTEQELSQGLWGLVRASEKMTGRTREDVAAGEQPLPRPEAGHPDDTPSMHPTLPSPREAQADKHRRPAVFEDVGVSQQAAWCGLPDTAPTLGTLSRAVTLCCVHAKILL